MCNCGCSKCKLKIKGPLLQENKVKFLLSEGLNYHINNNIPLSESVYRIGSEKYLSLIKEARKLYSRNLIDLNENDRDLINSHLGYFGNYKGQKVPLDLPIINNKLNEAEYQGKDVELNKPKRGGSKAYYVYVKDGDKVKKISFGSGGLRAKINDKDARTAFAKRHKCGQGEKKTSAKWWSCRLPKFSKQLGLGSNINTYW